MAKSEITSGVCGFITIVKTGMNGKICTVNIETKCEHIKKMSEELTKVDPYREISYKKGMPLTYELAVKYLPHAACPVPAGIIKTIEVEAKLALPRDVNIKISRD
jgi:hypothetical protein